MFIGFLRDVLIVFLGSFKGVSKKFQWNTFNIRMLELIWREGYCGLDKYVFFMLSKPPVKNWIEN